MEQAQLGWPAKGAGKRSRIACLYRVVLLGFALLGLSSSAWAISSHCPNIRPTLTAQGTISSLTAKLSRHEPVRILAIGSSSTEGIGATSPDHAYPAQLEDELADLWKSRVTVVNSGRGGETAIQTVERLEAALRAERFDLVIWQVGTNDAITGVAEESFQALLERGVAAAKSSGTDLILLDQQYFPSIKDLARYERFVRTVSTIGNARKVTVFSRYALMKEWNSRSPEELRSMLAADGFHMGDKGYDCLADCVADAIQAIVDQSFAQANASMNVAATVRDR